MSEGELETFATTVEEVFAIVHDEQLLYDYTSEQSWMNPQYNEFITDLPFEHIENCVKAEIENLQFFLAQDESIEVKMEHIGSTAVPRMPGTKNPDILMTLKNFPPNKETIKALMISGYQLKEKPNKGPKFRYTSCLWFVKYVACGPLVGQFIKIHIAEMGSETEKKLLGVKYLLLNNETAFEKYKDGKMKASKWLKTNYKKYKFSKAQCLPKVTEELGIAQNL